MPHARYYRLSLGYRILPLSPTMYRSHRRQPIPRFRQPPHASVAVLSQFLFSSFPPSSSRLSSSAFPLFFHVSSKILRDNCLFVYIVFAGSETPFTIPKYPCRNILIRMLNSRCDKFLLPSTSYYVFQSRATAVRRVSDIESR